METTSHLITVTAEDSGIIKVHPEEQIVHIGDTVFWQESTGRSLNLKFQDPDAFQHATFALTAENGTGLVAKKKGRHVYEVTASSGKGQPDGPPTVPVIIIMDPSTS